MKNINVLYPYLLHKNIKTNIDPKYESQTLDEIFIKLLFLFISAF